MPPPPKRSRIVNSLDTPSPTPSFSLFRKISTNNNVRRLTQSHTMTLRSSRNSRYTSRQTEGQAVHTVVQKNVELPDDDSHYSDVDNTIPIQTEADSQEAHNGAVPDVAGKRPTVHFFTLNVETSDSPNYLHRPDPAKIGYLIAANIWMRCFVTMAWERQTEHRHVLTVLHKTVSSSALTAFTGP